MASFNRKLKKNQLKKNDINDKKIDAVMTRDKDLLNNYLSEIKLTKTYNNEKTIVVDDELFLNNIKNFVEEFEEMGKKGKADFDNGKAQLSYAGIQEILDTKEIRVTTLRYFMLLMIFQLWDIATFKNSEEFEDACLNTNLKLLKDGFWHDNLYVIKYINKFFNFNFEDSGSFILEAK